MKKFYLFAVIAVVITFIAFQANYSLLPTASDASNFNFEPYLTNKQCGVPTVGKPVIDVQQRIINDADSGVAGNAWAMDTLRRSIQVWKTATADTYCGVVKYVGYFKTLAGASPQNTATVSAGIVGQFFGGYRTTLFTATLKTTPVKPVHGFLGTYDYACDTNFNCPGAVDWTTLYFDNVSGFDLAWWGWEYKTEKNGYWINKIDGNVGDITGSLMKGKDKDHDTDHGQDQKEHKPKHW